MLNIIGGTYIERCLEPDRNEIYGSGLRAAAAVSRLVKVHLHTYVAGSYAANVAANVVPYDIKFSASPSAAPLVFRYSHPLSTPAVFPSLGHIEQSAPIEVTGKAILRFGMLEGSGIVKGERVVYDPQSPIAPERFDANGSEAGELAIVSNQREASALSGRRKNGDIASHLMKKHGASTVVIKNGANGAFVYSGTKVQRVPAYQTPQVWKIGSGDVFAAAFAAFWAEKKATPYEAAHNASLAAATYCGNQAIPLSKDFRRVALTSFAPIRIKHLKNGKPPLVYLAGPFFTMAERWLVAEARMALLQQGIRVFSPFHDVGHGEADHVVPADLKALDKSDAVLAIVDGIDAGTLFEVGYAVSRKTPVVAFVQNEHAEALKMLHGSKCYVTDDFTSAIYNTAWAALKK